MNKMENLKRIEFLREEIIKHDILYSEERPIISDSDYDTLYMELVSLEDKYPEHISPESPTQKIYTTIVSGLEKIKHTEPMLSQEKIKTPGEIIKFTKGKNSKILVEQKIDGLTIVLTYENGLLVGAVSKGDGETGENIIHTVLTIKNLPKVIKSKERLKIRAEAIITYEEFYRIIETEDYANPRNLVAGTVRQFNASIAQQRNIQAIVFEYLEGHLSDVASDETRLEFLKDQGFTVVDYKLFDSNDAESIIEYCTTYNDKIRKQLPYMIDGLVLKVDDIELREELGTTSKHPKWSCAYKFESLEAITTLRKIDWQVGKTGQITPVGYFDSVDLDGSTVSKATLHNADYIIDKDIRVGDRIVVIKANDVIPKITSSIKSERPENTVPVDMPSACPICGAHASKKIIANGNLSSAIFCNGAECPSKLSQKLKHFVSRDAMNIVGLGESTIDTLLENNIIENLQDLYKIYDNPHLFYGIEGIGTKKYDKMVEEIEKSKSKPLSSVLYALSIPNVGTSTAKTIAKKYQSMTKMLEASKDKETFIDEVKNLKDVGLVVANNLHTYLEDNTEMLEGLLAYYVKMEEEIVETLESNITGKTFVVTGDVNVYANRKALQQDVEKHGGKVSGSVSSKTNFLINNDNTSTSGKNKDAQNLGIPIITEEDFIKMINS